MKFVNQTVRRGLASLGYSAEADVKEILEYVETRHSLAGAPHFKPEHSDVFACSIGDNVIDALGHVKMMAAVQPFLSGAISKTVNMPEDVSVEDVEEIYVEAWRLGVKAIAIYRDNCKAAQPLSVGEKDEESSGAEGEKKPAAAEDLVEFDPQKIGDGYVFRGAAVIRRQLPPVRNSKTFKFKVASSKGFMTVGEYEDGQPGEIFITVSKQGSTLAGVMDALAISVSHGLQYGVPLKSYVQAFINISFTPSGLTDDLEIRTASSLIDYIFRKVARTYLSHEDLIDLGIVSFSDQVVQGSAMQTGLLPEAEAESPAVDDKPGAAAEPPAEKQLGILERIAPINPVSDLSSPMCLACGNPTQRSGACYICRTCGLSTGCS